MFKDIFKSEKCECCNGTGKSHFHTFKFDKEEVEIIKKKFPKFNPEKSCRFCYGDGETDRFTTGLTNHELHTHMLDKIWDENLGRRRRE